MWGVPYQFVDIVDLAEDFRLACLRRRGRFGRYWARRRVPTYLVEATGWTRADLGKRSGGLFQLARRGH
jgi:hypothetical protein